MARKIFTDFELGPGNSLVLDGATSGAVTEKAAAATTSYTLTRPAAAPTAPSLRACDATGAESWAPMPAPGAGGYTNLFSYGGFGSTPSSGQVHDNGVAMTANGPYIYQNNSGGTSGQMDGINVFEGTDSININKVDGSGTDHSSLFASMVAGNTIDFLDVSGGDSGATITLTLTGAPTYGTNYTTAYTFTGTISHTGTNSTYDSYSVTFNSTGADEFKNITELYLHKLDRNGVDVSTWLASIGEGDRIRISDDTASTYVFLEVSGAATLSESVYALPVSYVTATSADGAFAVGDNLNLSWESVAPAPRASGDIAITITSGTAPAIIGVSSNGMYTIAYLSLAEDSQLSTGSGMEDGAIILHRLVQDTTGGWLLSFDSTVAVPSPITNPWASAGGSNGQTIDIMTVYNAEKAMLVVQSIIGPY